MKARQRCALVEAELGRTAAELTLTKEQLNWKAAFLEAQANSSSDGIIVVDPQGKKILQNERAAHLFKIPPHIAGQKDDAEQVRWVMAMTKNPEQFMEKVAYLYSHPEEISRDEIELKNGRVFDRYSSPAVGEDGKCHGRIWTFRDITKRKKAEALLLVQSAALEATANTKVITNTNGEIQWVNPAFTTMTGYSIAEVIGKKPNILKSGKHDEAFYRTLWKRISTGKRNNPARDSPAPLFAESRVHVK